MADFRALTIQAGQKQAIQDANRLLVGAGVRSATGPLSLSSPDGITIIEDNLVIASGKSWSTAVADGASAVAHVIDTPTAYITVGAVLLSIRNNGVQKLRFDKDGTLKNDTDVNTGPQVLESAGRMGIKAATEIRINAPLVQFTNTANIAFDSVPSTWGLGGQTTQFTQNGGVAFKLNGSASGSNVSNYEFICQSGANGIGYQAGATVSLTSASLQPNVVEVAQRIIIIDNRVALAGDALGQLIDVSGGSNVSGTKITQRLVGGYQEIQEITAPTVAVANALLLFSEDVGGVTKLAYLDSAAVKHSLTAYVPGTSGEALSAGNVVAFDDVAGNPRVFKADANGAGELVNAVGINLAAVGGSGSAVNVVVMGEVAIPDAIWDAVPGTGDVGKRVYMSETAGKLTLTEPATVGSTVLRIGHVTVGGAGAVKIVVQLGEGFVN